MVKIGCNENICIASDIHKEAQKEISDLISINSKLCEI